MNVKRREDEDCFIRTVFFCIIGNFVPYDTKPFVCIVFLS